MSKEAKVDEPKDWKKTAMQYKHERDVAREECHDWIEAYSAGEESRRLISEGRLRADQNLVELLAQSNKRESELKDALAARTTAEELHRTALAELGDAHATIDHVCRQRTQVSVAWVMVSIICVAEMFLLLHAAGLI